MSNNLQLQQIYDISSGSNSSSVMGSMFDSSTSDMSMADSSFSFSGDDINMNAPGFFTPSIPRQRADNIPPPMQGRRQIHGLATANSATSSPSPFATTMVTPVGILQTASHAQLVHAPNPTYVNMVNERDRLNAEFTGLKNAYELLLARVQAGNGLILSPEVWATPRPDDHPKILFWNEVDWSSNKPKASTYSEGSMNGKTKVNRGMNADLAAKRESMSFVEYEMGGSVIEADARLITNYMRKVFIDLQKHGEAVQLWTDVSVTATKYVYQEMYRAFPYLALCRGHWKIEKLANMLYSAWYRGAHGEEPGVRVKKEVVGGKVPLPGDEPSKRKQPPTDAKPSKAPKQIIMAAKKENPEGCSTALTADSLETFTLPPEEPNNSASSSATSTAATADGPSNPAGAAPAQVEVLQEPAKQGASIPSKLPLVNPLARFAKPAPATVTGSAPGTTATPTPPVGASASASTTPPGDPTQSTTAVIPAPDATAVSGESSAALNAASSVVVDRHPVTKSKIQKKPTPYKFDKTSCAQWNLFGVEYASKQATHPTRDEVKAAYASLDLETKQHWTNVREEKLAERKT